MKAFYLSMLNIDEIDRALARHYGLRPLRVRSWISLLIMMSGIGRVCLLRRWMSRITEDMFENLSPDEKAQNLQ